jgi:outer membrane receptor protein involved in Fe transport
LRGNYSTQRAGLSQALDSFGGAVPPDPSLVFGSIPPGQAAAFFAPFDGTAQYNLGPNANNRTKQLNFVDDLSLALGAHQLKFGGDYRAIFFDNVPVKHQLEYAILSVQDFISTGQLYAFVTQTALPARILSQSASLYAQDSWKASRRLVLTYGVRWELSPAPEGLAEVGRGALHAFDKAV